jgi:hypothetical protein
MTPKKLEAHVEAMNQRRDEIEAEIEKLEARIGNARGLVDVAADRVEDAKAWLEFEKARRDSIVALNERISAIEGEIERKSTELAEAQDAKEEATDGRFVEERIRQGEMTLKAKQAFDRDRERAESYDIDIEAQTAKRDRFDAIAQALKPDQVEAVFASKLVAPVRESIEVFGKRFGGMRLDSEFNVEMFWDGKWRRWHQLSESGRLRIGYAVQFTFAKLCGFPLLVLDQIDHLDAEGKFILLETLRDISPHFRCVVGLATLSRPKPSPAPIENVLTWHLHGGELRRVK